MVTPLVYRLLFSLLVSALCALPCAAETVLLEFSSASCGPCRQMRPVVEQLKSAGYNIREISVDRNPQMATRHRVDRWPTFIVLRDGRETSRLTGITSYGQLKEMLVRGGARPFAANADSRTAAPIVPLAQASAASGPHRDPTQPQPGRVVTLENPERPSFPQAPPAANPFHQASTGQAIPAGGSSNDLRCLIEATVKISIKDPEGSSAGTGTLVDARSGEALILTCGHLFRSSQGKGPITVTLYQLGQAGAEVRTTLSGNLIHYDLKRDLALVSIRPDIPISPVKIATPEVGLVAGSSVTSVGCNAGRNPTAVASRITTVDRYQGYPNVEVAGAPVEGRSGGGLFDSQGQLIGVCNAADPQGNEGLYASLPSIHQKLDELKLSMVYQHGTTAPQNSAPLQPVGAQPEPLLADAAALPDEDMMVCGQDAIPASEAPRTPSFPESLAAASQPPFSPPSTSPPNLSPAEQAALQEIAARGANSEVICIIRPQTPGGKSEVIKLQNVSPDFVRALTESNQTATNPAMAAGPANPYR